jgi:putative glutamine amidotransferase
MTCTLILLIGLVPGILPAQSQERYFDGPFIKDRPLTIAALHPTEGTLSTLLTLQKTGLLPKENIIIVGVFLEQELENVRERSSYKRAMELVEKKQLDHIKFHMIEGRLGPDKLFQENSCTADFLKLFSRSDGIIFFGGPDIPPVIYGEPTHLMTEITTPARHYLEVSLAFHLLGATGKSTKPLLETRPTYPVLGLCLGCQTLNVGAGGTLIQDIPAETYQIYSYEKITEMPSHTWHRSPFRYMYPEKKLSSFWLHPIALKKDGLFCREWQFKSGHRPYVYSSHHQAVGVPGKNFKIAATSLDGKVVEAIEHTLFPNVLGVQFHPEASRIWKQNDGFKYKPEDKQGKTIMEILEANPPSLLFHKLLWAWFSMELLEYNAVYSNQPISLDSPE